MSTPETHREVPHRGLITVSIMLGTIMQVLDTTIANVALPSMTGDLGASQDTINRVLTSYIVAAAIMTPVTGWLADRLGRKELFLTSVVGFVVMSMLCGIAWSLESMVAFRLMQGVFGAAIVPLSQTFLLDINPRERQGQAMAIWGAGIMVGPIIGPTLGGWLTESFNWRWVFFINLPVGIIAFLGSAAYLPSVARRIRNFDFFGFAMLSLGVGALQLMLDRGGEVDWFSAVEIWIELGLALTGFWVFIVHMVTAEHPFIDPKIFLDRNFATGLIFIFVIGVILLASLALLPPMLQQLFNYPVIDTGMMMAPRGVGVLFTMWFAGRLMTSGADTRWVIMLGLVLFAVSLRWMAGYTLEMDFWPVITAGFVQGLGMGLVFMPMNALAFATLDNRYRTDGASMLNLMRSIGQSAGISMVTVLLARNIQVSHADLVQHVTQDKVPAVNLSQIDQFGSIGDSIFSFADAMINQQAAMVAYIDDFYLMSWISIAAIPLVLLLKRPKGKMEIIHAE